MHALCGLWVGSLRLWSEKISSSGPCGAHFSMVMTPAHFCEPVEHTGHRPQNPPKIASESLFTCFTASSSPLVVIMGLGEVSCGSTSKAGCTLESLGGAWLKGCVTKPAGTYSFARIPSLNRASVWPPCRLNTAYPYDIWRLCAIKICSISITQASHCFYMSHGLP